VRRHPHPASRSRRAACGKGRVNGLAQKNMMEMEEKIERPFKDGVMVPVDFSKQSEVALRFGFEIARKTSSTVRLLHVIETPYEFASRRNEWADREHANARKELQSIRDGFLAVDEFAGLDVEIHVQPGIPTQAILEITRQQPQQLVVMGLSQVSGLNRMLYGSVTNRVLLESGSPILAVSDQLDYRPFERIVFATDFRERDVEMLLRSRALAQNLGVDMECIHFLTSREQTQEVYRKRTQLEGELDYQVVVQLMVADDFMEGVSRYLSKRPRTLLVIGRYRTSIFEWLLSNPPASAIAQVARVPLIMLPGNG